MSAVVSQPQYIPAAETSVRLKHASRRIDPRYWFVLGLCLLGGLAFLVDLPVSQWMHTRQALKALHQPLQVAEALGDGWGVAVILITLYIVCVERRRELPRIIFTVISTGLVSNIVKLCVSRLRPRSFPAEGLLDVKSVFDTFHGWLPFLRTTEGITGSRYQSFPSGHTATGFALAIALARMFPRAGWWFAVLAVMIALQRVETGAHYVTDTCFGAAIGLVVALSFQHGTPWSRKLDIYEGATN